MSFDPGLKNTAMAIIKVSSNEKAVLLASEKFNMNADGIICAIRPYPPQALQMKLKIKQAIELYRPTVFLVEYQPPVTMAHNQVLIRWNSWIEGYLFATLQELAPAGSIIDHVTPNAVKAFFKIRERSYHMTKKAVITKAQQMIREFPDILDDHICDCVLLSLYYAVDELGVVTSA